MPAPPTTTEKHMSASPSIAVVGGSLVGPALALMLNHAGFGNVCVYEATGADVSQVGGVIGIDYNALGILDNLGLDQSSIVPFPSERIVTIRYTDDGGKVTEESFFSGRTTSWNNLHGALLNATPTGALNFGQRVVNCYPGENGRAVLEFTDGTNISVDIVVFADGRRSVGRKLLQDRPLHFSGYVAVRGQGICDIEDLCDFVRYQPSHADGVQFNIFPVILPDGRIGVDWVLFTNMNSCTFHKFYGGFPTVRTFVLPHQITKAAHQHINRVADTLLPTDMAHLVHDTTTRFAVPIVDVTPPTSAVEWVGEAPAIIIGDALAPVHPNTASGLVNGLDQANGLAQGLRQHLVHGADLHNVLRGFQARYLPAVHRSIALGPQRAATMGLGELA